MTQLTDINHHSIPSAIRLACQTMSSCFNADDNDIPFFGSEAWPEARLSFSSAHSESHVPGRHLNALLNAAHLFDIDVNQAVEKHRQAAFFSYSGPFPLPLNRQEISGQLAFFCPHNVREGFHALYPLVQFRQDQQAQELAEKSIECILQLWHPSAGWNLQAFASEDIQFLHCLSFVHGLGRALGPLVKYYHTTGSPNALHLATLIKDKLVAEFFPADGSFDQAKLGWHTHSVTCCLSSLAQMAELTNNLKLLQHVQVFYDNGLNQMRDEIGWSPENTQQTTNDQTDHGEMNNSGDILETALILGQFGYDQYYNDAERIIRAHTLPSQLRDTSFIIEPDNPDNLDGLKNMGQRQQGAWGFPAPYGHKSINYGRGAISFNLDIVGGTTASLCQAYGHIARQDNTGIHLNLLFDYQDENIQIKSPYTNSALQIKALKPIPLYVRIPQWVDPQALKVSASQSPHFQTGSHLFFPAAAAYENITISFPLTLQTITMTKNHIHPIRVKLQGDQVLAMDNFGADFTFFDPIPD